MRYLLFELSEGDDGVHTLQAMASTPAGAHAAVMAEAQRVIAWAEAQFPDERGPVEHGMSWDADLLVQREEGGWHAVTLTLCGTPGFAAALLQAFGAPPE